ncbi:rab-3A-interacting protein isoform X2 [Trichomycterus rosablanca]|uniref:rab-3A-interacting protein isoform X2 n=1 Tax=Trichomycterus rosablanca TaxID=2290929 RepID=UPI002F35365C
MASEPLEDFHEVNLASPTTPDLHGIAETCMHKPSAPPSTLYRTQSLSSAVCPPTTFYADQLPTQPVYPAPKDLDINESHNGSVSGLEMAVSVFTSQEPGSVDGGSSLGEEGVDQLGLRTDGLSRLRSPSVMEVREKGYERLKEELAKAQREAHRMVQEANVKQATAEKQLKEALGKIDVLQAEVAALKTLVMSTSPTSPCKDLPLGSRVPFKKGHMRNKSTSSAMLGSQQEVTIPEPIIRDCKEVDSILFNEFKAWKEDPTLDRSCSFLEQIYREDIYPCLSFCKSELGSAILEAVENNTLSVEPVGFQPLPVVKASAVECGGPKKCALSGQSKTCKHRIKFGDSTSYYYVSPFCRFRITSVCNFFTYIRYIHQGLVKQQDAEQMFWEVMLLRKEMSYAKLGYYRDEL